MRRLNLTALLGAILFVLMPAAIGAAASVNPALYSGMHWRMIGPFRGGRALAVAGVPQYPMTFYFGAVAGGVWKSTDAGRLWTPIFDKEGIASIGAIAVAPSNPNVIYAGSGEADMRSDITYGDGMYKSSDGGATWSHVGLDDSRQIGRIIVDPADPNRVFVAVLGHGYGPNSERGVYRSLDGGQSWQRVLFKDANTGAIDLAFDPTDSKTIFAALWQTRRPPWSIYPPSNGPGSGLFVTHDGGDSWKQIQGGGFPSIGVGRMGIAISAAAPQRIYAIVDAAQGGLYRSDDGGTTWRRQNAERRLWGRGWYFCSMAVDTKNPDVVYISDTTFYRSTDGGAHFTPIKGSPDGDDFHQPWVDPSNGQHIILGSDQGASISVNGGATWSSWFNQPTAQFYHVVTDDRFPFDLFGAQQDSGAAMTASASDRIGIMGQEWRPIVAGGESGYIAVDPRDPNVIYGDTVTKENLANTQSQALDPTVAQPGLYRSQWTLPVVFSGVEPGVVYFGNQKLFRSADAGDTWHAISPDLSRPNPGVPSNLDAPTAADNDGTGVRRGVIYTIAPSPLRNGEIWCGTDDGKIWITRDEGVRWTDVTPPAVSAWSAIDLIEASAFDANTAYAAVDRHRLDDLRPHIYRTSDGGRSWTALTSGIPYGAYVHAVREDPAQRGLLFAATELGIYVSFDGGGAWQSLQLNMPVVPVRDLSIRDDSLAAATHGRAFWVLDDLAPLRQIAAGTAGGGVVLFAPESAIRVRPHLEPGESVPPEEPQGQNRPAGAYIDYALSSAPSGAVALSIYDASGRLVRNFSSADVPGPLDLETLDFPAYWAPTPQQLLATAGMHRFLWDFHYAAVSQLPGRREAGPAAPPGRYAIRLTVDGKTYAKPLTIVRDPRDEATDADLVAQFRLARAVDQLQNEAEQARQLSLHRGLSALAGGPAASSPDNSVGAPQTEFTSFYAVANALRALEALVESADARPTTDENAAFAHWQAVMRADSSKL